MRSGLFLLTGKARYGRWKLTDYEEVFDRLKEMGCVLRVPDHKSRKMELHFHHSDWRNNFEFATNAEIEAFCDGYEQAVRQDAVAHHMLLMMGKPIGVKTIPEVIDFIIGRGNELKADYEKANEPTTERE